MSGRRRTGPLAPKRRALAVALIAASVAPAACAKGAPFTAEDVRAAQARWQAAGITDYTLRLEIKGDRIEEGQLVVEVRDGAVASVHRNGQPVTTRDPFYTVDGMFRFLTDELEMAADPARYWQAAPGARIYQRAHFDDARGYTRRYLRSVSGTQHNIVVTVELQAP